VISGWTILENWVPIGNNIYKSNTISALQKVNLLVLDEVPQPLGRYPDEGYLSYEVGLTPNTLVVENSYSSLDLAGSQLVIRKNQWIIDKHRIQSVKDNHFQYLGESK